MPSSSTHWPDFIIFAAGKSGTTAFFESLCQHPGVHGSRLKEPNFFSYPELGLSTVPHGVTHRALTHTPEEHAYHALFADAPAGALRGEASVGYLLQPQAPARIQQVIPHVKLIAILRHPVDRTYSSWLHRRHDHVEPIADFESACQAGPERVRSGWESYWDYLNSSRYAHHLRPWLTTFPREQFKFFLYEDWQRRPHECLTEASHFLGLKPAPSQAIPRANVTSVQSRVRWLGWLLHRENTPRSLGRRTLPLSWRQATTGWLRRLNRQSPPRLDPELRQQLIRHFESDIRELENMLGRNLDAWLQPDGTR